MRKARIGGALLSALAMVLSGCQTGAGAPADGLQVEQNEHITVDARYTTYAVEGSTAEELRQQLDQLGVVDESGEHFEGHTEWEVTWAYAYRQNGGGCAAGQAEVLVEIHILLPEWEPPRQAPEALVSKWDEFRRALRAHEEGHGQIAVEAAEQIYEALSNLPVYPTCEGLEKAADELGENLLESHRRREKAYDAESNHGRNQGAHFP